MYNGIINVYKDAGYTSHDVVAKLRGIFGQRKIGHTGTLDPAATGVLPVCLGQGTKLVDMITDRSKTYEARVLLGVTTDTEDTTGTQTEKKELAGEFFDGNEQQIAQKINAVLEKFVGGYDQIPPMFSAIKINGQKLYNLARKGEEIERPPRHCKIIDITITKIDLPRVSFHVTCSKGTYVRTLCYDIGKDLGVGACMEKCTRTRVERFDIKDSISLSQIEEIRDQGVLEQYITPVDEILDMYSKCMVSEEAEKLLYNGNIFTSRNTLLKMNHQDGQTVRVYTHDGKFIGLYMYIAEKQIYKPIKIFL